MTKLKDALILFVITIVAGLLLGGVNEVTKEPIAEQEALRIARAYQAVSPQAQSFETSEKISALLERSDALLADSGLDLGNVQIEDAVEALDASGNLVGYVVKATSKDGYNGAITLAAGVSLDGTLQGIDFIAINETKGLGMKAIEAPFKDQFQNRTGGPLELTKSGAPGENEIDAIGGATFTSSATVHAVNAAITFASACMEQ